jgi:hypothetical protein
MSKIIEVPTEDDVFVSWAKGKHVKARKLYQDESVGFFREAQAAGKSILCRVTDITKYTEVVARYRFKFVLGIHAPNLIPPDWTEYDFRAYWSVGAIPLGNPSEAHFTPLNKFFKYVEVTQPMLVQTDDHWPHWLKTNTGLDALKRWEQFDKNPRFDIGHPHGLTYSLDLHKTMDLVNIGRFMPHILAAYAKVSEEFFNAGEVAPWTHK